MNEIFPFIKANSDWIKDVATIVFAGTGTVIGILSYRKAKSSIFQPKRTEVTKVQTDILLDFLSKFTTDGNSIDQAIDYRSILSYNLELALRDYNLLKIDPQSKKYEILSNSIAGWYENPGDIYSINVEEGSLEQYHKFYYNPIHPKGLEKEQINIERIFFTKRHYEFIKKLKDLSSHPFLNKEIQNAANRLAKHLTINIQEKAKKVIEEQIIAIYKTYIEEKNSSDLNLQVTLKHAVMFPLFSINRIDHSEDYDLLIKEIRKHLMIDEKW